jgi:hypothetical protein
MHTCIRAYVRARIRAGQTLLVYRESFNLIMYSCTCMRVCMVLSMRVMKLQSSERCVQHPLARHHCFFCCTLKVTQDTVSHARRHQMSSHCFSRRVCAHVFEACTPVSSNVQMEVHTDALCLCHCTSRPCSCSGQRLLEQGTRSLRSHEPCTCHLFRPCTAIW